MRSLNPIQGSDFRRLAEMRLWESSALLAVGHYSGAYYLAGYAVEGALKACICKQQPGQVFPSRSAVPSVYTHDVERLTRVAGLETLLRNESASDAVFASYWTVAKDWTEQSRYAFPRRVDAEHLYIAVSDVGHGVLRWLRQYW